MDSRELSRDIAGCAASHRRLLSAVEGLDDAAVRLPSLLPDWTIAHVLAHLARNADSHVRILQAAELGVTETQYEGGAAGRAMDIASGAERDAESLLADLDASIARLEQTWSVTTDTAWQGRGLTLRGEVSTLALPFRRWVEVEVHHVDLGLGYSFEQLPSDFVGLELRNLSASWASRQPMGLTDLPDAARRLAPHDRLAWLLGRLEINGLAPAGVYG